MMRTLLGAVALLWAASLPAAAADLNPALAALYEKAKAEKEVVLSGPAAVEVEWVPEYFAKRFPGIEVRTVADLQAATKIIAEARAGRHSFDTWSFSLGGMIEVEKRDLLEKIDWARFGLALGNVAFDGHAIATHNFVYSVVYAKDHIAASELPRTWDDLTDPKWTGKLTAQTFLLPRLMGFLALGWGPERTERWGRTLIDERKLLVTNAPAEALLKSGERVLAVGDSVALSYRYTADGVPSGYVVMDTVPAAQFAVAVFKDAPHPNAALLLAAWLASDEGRALYESVIHEADIRPGSTSALAAEIHAKGSRIVLEDTDTMDQRAKYYESFSALVRGEK
ncbi:MAG TPA: extracellular solute-binding protein [Stellaceae bacterium]|nr:extracellular solute-binding protein [Stellaceae bacterium]